MKKLNIQAYLAEFIGTFILVLIGTGCATIYGNSVTGIIGTSLAFGLALMAVYYALGNISGAHVNPAVSLAMYFDGRLSVIDLCGYIIAQLLGAFAGSGMLLAILKNVPSATIKSIGLGANSYGSASTLQVTSTGALITEIALTFIFVLAVLGTTKKNNYNSTGGIAIGGALTLVHLLGYSITGTSVNPARSLGPALVLKLLGYGTALSQVWVFIAGPIIGSLIAVVLFRAVNYKQK